jgi:hypothetical protein
MRKDAANYDTIGNSVQYMGTRASHLRNNSTGGLKRPPTALAFIFKYSLDPALPVSSWKRF